MYDWYEELHPGWKENHDKWPEITDDMWFKLATDLCYRKKFTDGFAAEKATVDKLFNHIDEIFKIVGVRKE
jgi:hypothetical protein